MRAGPFSDERIVRLANRRFVPVYFDLSNRGFAGDADARAFVVEARPRYGGRSVPTPNVLLMSPAGEVLGEVSNYATEEQVLQKMLAVLAANPAYDKPGDDETRVTSPVARARIRIDLQDHDGARKELERAGGDEAHYLLGRIARFERKWEEMEKHLAQVKSAEMAADVRMERAYLLWHEKKYGLLRDHLKDFPKSSSRYTEARYHEGLALFHLGKKDAAMAAWKATITACAQDPWIYRADWAYTETKKGRGRRGFYSSAGPKTSLLNRIGYMGRKNPDLHR